jgi:hypothetical protein
LLFQLEIVTEIFEHILTCNFIKKLGFPDDKIAMAGIPNRPIYANGWPAPTSGSFSSGGASHAGSPRGDFGSSGSFGPALPEYCYDRFNGSKICCNNNPYPYCYDYGLTDPLCIRPENDIDQKAAGPLKQIYFIFNFGNTNQDNNLPKNLPGGISKIFAVNPHNIKKENSNNFTITSSPIHLEQDQNDNEKMTKYKYEKISNIFNIS